MAELSTGVIEKREGSTRRWFALCIIVLAAFMTTLDDFIVFVAIPAIKQDLQMNAAEIQWLIAGYVLIYGVMVVSGGRLGDIYGHKRTFIFGLWGFTLASLLCGLAPNTLFLLAARLLEGLMAALMFPQVFSLIKWMFPEKEQGMALGILGAVIGVSAIGGQIVGGLLLDARMWGLGWRPIFYINVPVGILAALTALPLLQESRSATARRIDWPGVLLASATLLLIMVPLVQGREMGWPLWTYVCLIAFLPILWLFIRYERYRTASIGSPLLELSLFRNQIFTRGITILLLETALGSGLFFVLALYLQTGHHFTALEAGLAFTPMAITYTVGSLASGRLIPLLGTRILLIGIIIATIGTLWTLFVVQTVGSEVSIFSLLPLAVMGFGNALVATPLPTFIIASAGHDAAGAASGAISTAQQLGAAIGVAMMGAIFFSILGTSQAESAYTNSFATSLLYGTLAICIIHLLLALGIPRTAEKPLERTMQD